jgi:hypothetical protein
MADYYTDFSFLVPVKDEAVAAELHQLLERAAEMAEAVWNEGEDLDGHPIFGDDPDLFYGHPAVSYKDGGVWVSSDAGESSIDPTIAIVQWLLSQPGAPESVTFEWANTCSKPRLDAFSGGIARVTKDASASVWTGEPEVEALLDERLRQLRQIADQ